MTKRYWWIIATYIIMQLSVPAIVMVFPINNAETLIYLTIFSFIIALIVTLFLLKPDMTQKNLRGNHNVSQIILWSIVGVFMAYFSQIVAVMIEMALFKTPPGSENTMQIMDIARAVPIFMLIPALVAPILEEVIFRKIIFGALYKRMNFFLAAILSAFIFGIIHNDPAHILIYAAMGLVFAFLYVKTKSILTPIIVHMAMNSMTVIAQFNLDPDDIIKMQEQFENMQTILLGG